MNRAVNTVLIPVTELAPGAVAKIRNSVIESLVALASRELNKPPESLVVRDIRSYDDLHWGTGTTITTSALTENIWSFTLDDSETDGAFNELNSSTYYTMSDSRYIAIYGVKDGRMALATPIVQALSELKFVVGGNDRAIWDIQGMYAYPNAMAMVTPSAVVIPQNTDYQIQAYNGVSDDGVGSGSGTDTVSYVMLEGVVVEPMGKVLSP